MESLKSLYKIVFNDSSIFIDEYFNRLVNSRNTFTIECDGKIVASMQMFEFEAKACGQILHCGYIYAVMTHPEYRRQGYMSRLMISVLSEAQNRKYDFVFLVEQEPYLRNIYSKFGFKPSFSIKNECYSVVPSNNTCVVDARNDIAFEIYVGMKFDAVYLPRKIFDFEVDTIVAEGGKSYYVETENGERAWGLFIKKNDCTLRVLELVGNDNLCQILIKHAACMLSCCDVITSQHGGNIRHGMACLLSDSVNFDMLKSMYVSLLLDE